MDAWGDPGMRHAMVVHFPIVLSVVGIPAAVAAALITDKTKAMRWTALALYVGLALSGMLARSSGHGARDAVYGSLSDEGQRLLEEHDELGHKVWLFGVAVAVLVGVSFARNRMLRLPSSWLAVAAAIAAAGWTANTADHGGRLVYDHGAGTRSANTALPGRAPSAGPGEDARVRYFAQVIRPILTDNCFRCHNPRRAERAGGLDQTTIAGWLTGGRSGPAVVPGRPDESLVIHAVRGTDPDFRMPPGDEVLTDAQIAALERWIAEGVTWEPFEFQLPDD
jgi:mono/diheme cytochrome c family protein